MSTRSVMSTCINTAPLSRLRLKTLSRYQRSPSSVMHRYSIRNRGASPARTERIPESAWAAAASPFRAAVSHVSRYSVPTGRLGMSTTHDSSSRQARLTPMIVPSPSSTAAMESKESKKSRASTCACSISREALLRCRAAARIWPARRSRSTISSGQARSSRKAPIASAQVGRSPTRIGIVRFDRIPSLAAYSLSAVASGGRSSGIFSRITLRPAASSL